MLLICTGQDTLTESDKSILHPIPVPIMSYEEYPVPINSDEENVESIPTSPSEEPTSSGSGMRPSLLPTVATDEKVSPVALRGTNRRKKGNLAKQVGKTRFKRCSKGVKHLCEVCSKTDCMICSNCM